MAWSAATHRVSKSVVRSLGQTAIYTAAGQSAIVMPKVVFDSEYTSVSVIDGVAVESKRPVLTVNLDDLVVNGDTSNRVTSPEFNESVSGQQIAAPWAIVPKTGFGDGSDYYTVTHGTFSFVRFRNTLDTVNGSEVLFVNGLPDDSTLWPTASVGEAFIASCIMRDVNDVSPLLATSAQLVLDYRNSGGTAVGTFTQTASGIPGTSVFVSVSGAAPAGSAYATLSIEYLRAGFPVNGAIDLIGPVKLSRVPAAFKQNDAVAVDGVDYTVKEVRPDSQARSIMFDLFKV